MPLAIIALTIATFGIGTSEFVIMGLLPEVAHDLGVSIPKTGMLVSVYAMGVVIGAPLLAIATARVPRKSTLLGLIVLFIIGNILCALAETYNLLMAARIIAALCHGTFFGLASVVATDLVQPNRRARAIALVFMGVTLANVLGVPLGTAIGQAFGWRAAFWGVSAIGIVAIIAVIAWLPSNIPMKKISPKLEFKTLMQKKVQTALLLSVLTNTSLFTVFTYIAPLLREVTRVSEHGVTIVLLILGVGLSIGSVLGGWLGDKNLVGSMTRLIAILIGILLALHYTIGFYLPAVLTLFIWSIVAFALCPMLQLLVVDQARDAPNLASTFNQSAFNLGNALGAWLGGTLLAFGLHLQQLPLAAMAVMIVALVTMLRLRMHFRRVAIVQPIS
ncbi:putative membrane transport protein [Yersinia enterocolitica]|uniref:MFS transporter n=1 Tax=Yersinia enterocolitica TaxID=630 RepID=UPI00061BB8EE|nr:MFS transporter [Yersinia enterocolitica]CNC14309.1 putative membrane transport protein [Yersinia enterocolitica]